MNLNRRFYILLWLIVALILGAQPAAAAIESFSGPGYDGVLDYVEPGGWQSYTLDVKSDDDFNILALAYSEANDFDLYVSDPISGTIITSATEPYSSQNGLNFVWAASTLNPGRYTIGIHPNSGSGNFVVFHFNKNMQAQTATPAPTTITTQAPANNLPDLITPGRVLIYDMVSSFSSYGKPVNGAQTVHTFTITGVQGMSYSVTDTVHIVGTSDVYDKKLQFNYPSFEGPFVEALYAPPENPTSVFQPPFRIMGRMTYEGNPFSNGAFSTNNAVALQGSVPDSGTSVNVYIDGETGVVLSMVYNSPTQKYNMYLREVR